MTKDPIIIAWAAGIIEGEGYIGIYDNRVRVVVEMTDLDVLERLHQNFGGSLLAQKQRQENWKPSWKWQLTSSESAKEFLKAVYPLLGRRRQDRCNEAFALQPNNLKAEKTAELTKRVYQLRDSGLTHQAISGILGYDRSYISHILRKRNC